MNSSVTYKTSLPKNIAEENVHLFKNRQSYQLPLLRVKQMKNVFISNQGLVVKCGLLPLKSAENLIGNYDQTFYWTHWKKAIEQFLVCKYGKSLKGIRLNDNTLYFSIHTPWFGYFTWFTTYIPRLIMVLDRYPDATLLVPEEWETISYVNDSLKMFPDLKKKTVPRDNHLFVKNYVFAEVRPWTSIFYPEHIFKVRDVCLNYLQQHPVTIKAISKLYVSRKRANRRKIVNEQAVEEYLIQLGFQSVCFEDYSVFEQMYLMRHADMLVSMHGAGLTNCMFMQPQTTLVEITPIVKTPEQFRLPFWRMASLLDINYYVQFCKTVDNGEKDIYTRNMEVDVSELKRIINLVENKQYIKTTKV
jgi:hypothetical protein